MIANGITLFRTLLCFLIVGLLVELEPSAPLYWACFWMTIVVIFLDGVDGYAARKFHEESKAGAVIDIIGDRVVEQVYWVAFMALGWIPLWIPMVVIIRGVVVDGFRAIALEKGYTAFGSSSMMQSPLGVLLVSSRFSRWTYAVAKGFAFAGLIWAHLPPVNDLPGWVPPVAYGAVYLSVFFCVVRGLPVLVESKRFLFDAPSKVA